MTSEDRPNQFYPITNPRTGATYKPNPNRVWRFEPATMQRVIEDDLIIWPDETDGNMKRPRYKTIFNPDDPKIKPVSSWIEASSRKASEIEAEAQEAGIGTITSGLNAEGGRVLQKIMGQKTFDYPKPLSLITSLVQIAAGRGDVVLDSCAGSGTTAHAVLALNAEDGGNRRFILVQQKHDSKDDENSDINICRTVTAERVRRVINGVNTEPLGGSFTYCTLSDDPLRGYYGLVRPGTTWEELAGYVWQAETLQSFDPVGADPETGLVGRTDSLAVYLLYTPEGDESRAFSDDTLAALAGEPAKTLLVYCEKLWLAPETIRDWARDQKKDVRARLLPTQLR